LNINEIAFSIGKKKIILSDKKDNLHGLVYNY